MELSISIANVSYGVLTDNDTPKSPVPQTCKLACVTTDGDEHPHTSPSSQGKEDGPHQDLESISTHKLTTKESSTSIEHSTIDKQKEKRRDSTGSVSHSGTQDDQNENSMMIRGKLSKPTTQEGSKEAKSSKSMDSDYPGKLSLTKEDPITEREYEKINKSPANDRLEEERQDTPYYTVIPEEIKLTSKKDNDSIYEYPLCSSDDNANQTASTKHGPAARDIYKSAGSDSEEDGAGNQVDNYSYALPELSMGYTKLIKQQAKTGEGYVNAKQDTSTNLSGNAEVVYTNTTIAPGSSSTEVTDYINMNYKAPDTQGSENSNAEVVYTNTTIDPGGGSTEVTDYINMNYKVPDTKGSENSTTEDYVNVNLSNDDETEAAQASKATEAAGYVNITHDTDTKAHSSEHVGNEEDSDLQQVHQANSIEQTIKMFESISKE